MPDRDAAAARCSASVNGPLTLFSGFWFASHSRPQASWDNDLVIAFVAAAAIRQWLGVMAELCQTLAADCADL